MIECVPNFSVGRDAAPHAAPHPAPHPAKIRAIVEAIESVRDVLLLGWESDADHNRSVVTFAGEPEAVTEAAIRGAGKAAELIDLNRHKGLHPRVGSADVIPFAPLEGGTIEACVDAAHSAGAEIWRRYGVPVYFYEAAARIPARRRLEKVRRKGFDGAPPDIGGIAAHPTAGASMVGARGVLIAYNVNVTAQNDAAAKAIARTIRESSGGLRFVKAMGLYLPSRGCAQVSMNLTNFAETDLDCLYETICREAARLRTTVASSQLIGFIPRRAFEMAPEFFRRTENFKESRILETRIHQLLQSK